MKVKLYDYIDLNDEEVKDLKAGFLLQGGEEKEAEKMAIRELIRQDFRKEDMGIEILPDNWGEPGYIDDIMKRRKE